MDIVQILDTLCQHYAFTRGVGHTTALVEGLKNINTGRTFFLTGNRYLSQSIISKNCTTNVEGICLDDIEFRLRGVQVPLVIDNSALVTIFYEALNKIHELEFENWKLRSED